MGVCVRGGDSYYDLSIAKIPYWKVVYRLIHEIGNTHTHTLTSIPLDISSFLFHFFVGREKVFCVRL